MGKSRFIELMAKSIDRSASEAELKELQQYLEEHSQYKQVQTITNELQSSLKTSEAFEHKDMEKNIGAIWNKINTSIPSINRSKGVRALYSYKWLAAAMVLLCVTVIAGIYLHKLNTASPMALAKPMIKVVVPNTETAHLVLADGTKVRLNSGSVFYYPESFAGDKREVKLQGEGYFEVTKNPHKPFLVSTNTLTVKVLGTVFNVKAYPHDKKTETTLFSGKVQVTMHNKLKEKVELVPNEKLTVNNQLITAPSLPVNGGINHTYKVLTLPEIPETINKETAWLSNKIVFANDSFDEVANQLERKYDIHIVFKDKALEKEQISGVLENERLEKALGLLKRTTDFNFKIEGKVVYLYSTTSK